MNISKFIRKGSRVFVFYFSILMCTSAYSLSADESAEPGITDTWSTVYPPFKDEGALVEGADIVGGHILGSVGFVVGIPLGFVGGLVTQITHDDPNLGFDGTLQASSDGFSIVGKFLLGLPVYVVKKMTYDLPAALISTDITYNKRKRKDGSRKIRH